MSGAPGIQTHPGSKPNIVLKPGSPAWPISGVIDKTSRDPWNSDSVYVLRPGLVLAKHADTGKWHVHRGCLTDAQEAIGQTTISVADTDPFQVGDNIIICEVDGSEVEDLGAITAITEGVSITITTALQAQKETGSYVWVGTADDDNLGYPAGILAGECKVVDEDGNAVDATAEIIAGFAAINEDNCLENLTGWARLCLSLRGMLFDSVLVEVAEAGRTYLSTL
jgi:hypothetical protein